MVLRRRAQKSRRDESNIRDGRKEMEKINTYIYIVMHVICSGNRLFIT